MRCNDCQKPLNELQDKWSSYMYLINLFFILFDEQQITEATMTNAINRLQNFGRYAEGLVIQDRNSLDLSCNIVDFLINQVDEESKDIFVKERVNMIDKLEPHLRMIL